VKLSKRHSLPPRWHFSRTTTPDTCYSVSCILYPVSRHLTPESCLLSRRDLRRLDGNRLRGGD
jgi:hypothetical protein